MTTIIRRRIVEVKPYRGYSLQPRVYGGCIPLVLDCGHEVEANFTFSYRVGDETRCSACERESDQPRSGDTGRR